ncbi:hypothetical protein Acsp04_34450 [Actinomadura sp. NBRC 104425]|nr:hypothetical protein Acsp04_34450 [Actinomadura sp. NBRC 104425]
MTRVRPGPFRPSALPGSELAPVSRHALPPDITRAYRGPGPATLGNTTVGDETGAGTTHQEVC